MEQGRKTFDITMEEAKRIADEIFRLKELHYEEVGNSGYASSPDGKKSYKLNFTERDGDTEVTVAIETKKGLRAMFKKKDIFARDEELEGFWRLFQLKIPKPEDESLTAFIQGLLNDISEGKDEVRIPGGVEVRTAGGGMLLIRDKEEGISREVLLPKGTGTITVGDGIIRVGK